MPDPLQPGQAPTSTACQSVRAALAILALAGGFAAAPSVASAACPASSSYSSLVAGTPGLVGYWRLGESSGSSACDVTGSGGGTYSGTVALGRAGALSGDPNTAARFSADGQVTVPHSTALDLNGEFTLEAWVKPETLPSSGFPGVLRKGDASVADASGGWLLYYDSASRQVTFKRQNQEERVPAWTLGPVGTWSYVALTYSGSSDNTLRLYLNGTLVGAIAGPAGGFGALNSTDPLRIGHGDQDSADQTVDEPAIYSVALSSAAILQHYQTGHGSGSGAPPDPPSHLSALGSQGGVSLVWSPPNSTDVASYRVYRRNPDGTWPSGALIALPGSSLAYTDSPVANATTYDYRVTAVSSTGAESPASNETAATPSGSLPADFSAQTLVSGLTRPTAVAWTPDGRMFVAEKDGVVRVVDASGTLLPAPLIDISGEVNSPSDRGLLGIAVDSSFATNHYLYLLYTYELNPLSPDSLSPMVSRLTRVTVNPDNTLVNPGAPETVILGTDAAGPCATPSNSDDCIPSEGPSHSIGTVRSDPDGTLWIGSGDASAFNVVDSQAFRVYNEQSFAGKVIHVDRNGQGLPGHPFCPSDTNLNDVCTKLYAKGFRNPFRFSLRPGSTPIVGDVGWNTREEIDLLQPGGNYGWPCYEGTLHTPGYSDDSRCATEYAREGTSSADVLPDFNYDHPGSSSAVVGGPVYTGSAYPAGYAGSAFFGDYVRHFVQRIEFDAQGHVADVEEFAPQWNGVDLETAPNGNLVFTDLGNFSPGAGSVNEWVYTPGNGPPVAHASATPTSGPHPLGVQFTGSGSTDPDNDALTYNWDFGDGTTHSAQADPSHTYAADGTYTARLRVNDGHSHTAFDTVGIQVGNNTPPTATIASPADGSTYRDGQYLQLQGSGTDAEDGTLPDSSLSWHVVLHHSTHLHDLGTFSGTQAVFQARTDHDANSYYEVTLTATDSQSRTDTKTITLHPETVNMTLASSPGGVGLSYSGTAVTSPAALVTAIGYQATVSAPDTYESGGQTYQFVSWSDGAARVHDITVPTADFTLTATYQAPLAPPPPLPPPPAPSTAAAPSTSIVSPPGAGPGTGRATPRLTGVSLTHRRFRVARAPTALSARRAPAGTELRYSLSENANMSIKVDRLERGVSAGRRCLRRHQGLSGRSCSRASRRGTLRRRARAGANRLPFSGRLGKRALAPGAYRATITATDAAGKRSRAATLNFTVVTG